MEEKYLLMLDSEYYCGIYQGDISTGTYKEATRFSSKEALLKELSVHNNIVEYDIQENYTEVKIINILEWN